MRPFRRSRSAGRGSRTRCWSSRAWRRLRRNETSCHVRTETTAGRSLRRDHEQDNIRGKVVVITGASSGLGEATARYLAERGATVVLGARRADRLQTLVDEITGQGGQAFALATDVTDAAQVQALVDAAVEPYGRIDVHRSTTPA